MSGAYILLVGGPQITPTVVVGIKAGPGRGLGKFSGIPKAENPLELLGVERLGDA